MDHHLSTTTDRHALRRAGAWLLAASALWWVAAVALIPADDYFLGETALDEARSAHAGMFRAFHVVALFGVAAGAVGVGLAARSFRDGSRSALLRSATALSLVGLAGWAAEVIVRVTATVGRARDVGRARPPSPTSRPSGRGRAWALARHRQPSRRASVVVAVLVSLVTLAGMATLAPSVIYQFGALVLALPLVLSRRAAAEAAGRETRARAGVGGVL